jgi:tetratricopeptide (TPR) repeat protein
MAYQEAIRLDPTFHEAYINIGLVLGEQGHYEGAVEAFVAALRIKPDDAEVHYDLGMLLMRRGQVTRGREHLQEAIRLNPAHRGAIEALKGQRE